jgi:AcrR family transcriptional regulator
VARRRARQQEIVVSTRELFDARGMRSANIDDISKAVGINRAIIYRHFATKEELFALTLAEYLAELSGLLSAADDETASPQVRMAAVSREFATYCLRYPAFVDCALALLGRPGPDLLDEISDSALRRLSGLMAAQLKRIAQILSEAPERSGAPSGEATTSATDVDLLANALYMQSLGLMHLARSGVVLRPSAEGDTRWFAVEPEQIIDLVIRMALAVAFPGSD